MGLFGASNATQGIEMKTRLLVLAIVAAIISFAGAGGAFAAQAQPAASAGSLETDYRLGPADKVRVIVFGEDTLSGEFMVSGNGTISMPLVGDIRAMGMTIPEFQQALQAVLRDGYLLDPRVSAEVLNYRPFYILGEVMEPGEYPFTNNLTVLNAVATAGGFTYRAAKDRVFVKRNGESAERREALTAGTRVWPGDTIRIGERLF